MRRISLFLIFISFQSYSICFASEIDSLLTSKEIRWLNKHKNNIRFAPNPSWPPGDYVDDQGIHQGIVSDYIRIFENKLGISFTNVYLSNWSNILAGLKNSEVDFVGAIQKTREREDYLLYTDAYMKIPVVILVRSNYPNLITKDHIDEMKLAGVTDYTSIDYIKNTYSQANITEFKDDLTAIMQTSLGNVDGTVIDLMTASYLVEKYGINNLALGITLDYTWDIRFASRNELPELTSILNKLLSTIDENRKQEIYQKWVSIDNIEASNMFERNYQRLIYLTGAILLIILAIAFYSYTLKKQVKVKTRDLQHEIAEKEKTEEELKKSLKEREVLLSEVHHRVKNNLAIISGLLELESMDMEYGETLDILSNSVMRIKSIAMVHEQLYATADFKSIPFHSYVDELLTTAKNKFNADGNIQIEKNLTDVYLNINLAVPAALLINELITNAFKHAFTDKEEGLLEFEISNHEDEVTLKVKDNGIGLPDDINLKDPNTVGFTLVKALASQLDADYTIKAKAGTCFRFSFKNYNKKGSGGNIFPSLN